MSEAPHEYASGAKRSEKLPLMRLIPHSTLRHLALALTEGNRKYEMIDGRHCPTTCNWRNGDLQFQLDCADHLMNHVTTFCDQLLRYGLDPQPVSVQKTKDSLLLELGHALANIAFLIEFIEHGLLRDMQVEHVTVKDIKQKKEYAMQKFFRGFDSLPTSMQSLAQEFPEDLKTEINGVVFDKPAPVVDVVKPDVKYPRYFMSECDAVNLLCRTGEGYWDIKFVRAADGSEEGCPAVGTLMWPWPHSKYSKEVFPAWSVKLEPEAAAAVKQMREEVEHVRQDLAESKSDAEDSWKATEVTDKPVVKYPRYFQRQPQSKADVWLYGHTSETERQWFRTRTGDAGLEILGASVELLDQEYTEEVFPEWAAK